MVVISPDNGHHPTRHTSSLPSEGDRFSSTAFQALYPLKDGCGNGCVDLLGEVGGKLLGHSLEGGPAGFQDFRDRPDDDPAGDPRPVPRLEEMAAYDVVDPVVVPVADGHRQLHRLSLDLVTLYLT